MTGYPCLDKLTGKRELWPETFVLDREIDRAMLCLEAANAAVDYRHLAPGEHHSPTTEPGVSTSNDA
ncbi:hypothetical protein [Saccharospirillum sp.]|uniref:hypothetical protein n=1 Tax=Saccharospirillum sp. TaxID=2033801 RepID=UPI0034A00D9C